MYASSTGYGVGHDAEQLPQRPREARLEALWELERAGGLLDELLLAAEAARALLLLGQVQLQAEAAEVLSMVKFEGNFCRAMLRLANLVEQLKSASLVCERFGVISKLDNYEMLLFNGVINNDSLYFVN